jgi:hypothetical protein
VHTYQLLVWLAVSANGRDNLRRTQTVRNAHLRLELVNPRQIRVIHTRSNFNLKRSRRYVELRYFAHEISRFLVSVQCELSTLLRALLLPFEHG